MSFYVFCILFFLEMKRRAIANFTATSKANNIHATQNIYIPYSKNRTSIQHTRHYTFLHILVRRHEKESYRKTYTDNICIYLTCYTTHILFSMSRTFLLLEVRRRAIAHLQENHMHLSYMLHKTYTIHIRNISPRQNTHVLILYCICLSPRNEKESYRTFYNGHICQYHESILKKTKITKKNCNN